MSGNARRLAEAANQIVNPQPIVEAFKAGDKVKVPHKGKMVSGKIVRYDDGGTSKARQSGGGYVVDVGEPASILVPKQNVQKEEAEQIDEVRSLYTDELLDAIEKAYKKGGLRGVIKGDKQVSDTTVDEVLRDMKPLFGNDMEYAVKKIKRLLKPQDYTKYKTKMEEVEQNREEVVTEAEWKSLKKTKVDLNALRQQGYKISVQHGEGDTLYKITGKPSKPAMKKESAEITEAPYTPANDYEGEMAMTQLKSIIEKANDVLGMLKPEAKMEAWVQSKITLADEYISTVRDYLKHTDGAIG